MTAIEFLLDLHDVGWLPASTEKTGYPTRSEVRRWLERGSVRINGVTVRQETEISLPIESLVLFEKSPRKTTMR